MVFFIAARVTGFLGFGMMPFKEVMLQVAGTILTWPSSFIRKLILSPLSRCRNSRISLGMVIWPLLVTVAVVIIFSLLIQLISYFMVRILIEKM
ncbi:MAG: hypothetical protein ACI9SC_001510 [Gammaproteobacteria bacterium]|jgi:hypothetical protein